jgi:16S rRNA (cytosine967-C5)-methyltransferase
MSRVGSQQRILLELIARLRPHWRRDLALPARIERILSGDRRFGSRDRRLYRELIYTALRYLPWIEPLLTHSPGRAVAILAWLAADTPATRAFRAESAGSLLPCPETIEARAAVLGLDPELLLPAWLRDECPEALASAQRDALLRRPPLWVRLQTDAPAAVRAEFEARGWPWSPSPLLEGAIALPLDADVAATEAYRTGQVEIQDIGSQRVLAVGRIPAGGRWLDACAGAGGKTLQLARLLGPGGRVEAADVRPAALAELQRRAVRAGLAGQISLAGAATAAASASGIASAHAATPRPLLFPLPGADDSAANRGAGNSAIRSATGTAVYDGVLIDAPCSGSGTWRRSPHLQWTTTPGQIRAKAQRQARLLADHASLIRPGGQLVYATCSLCRTENEAVIAGFLEHQRGFAAEIPGLRLWPADHDGDGFFVAWLHRRA